MGKGFTLIELAVIIAVLAILAAVAIPKFIDGAVKSELSVLKDLKGRLSSSAATYTARTSHAPNNFGDFVVNTPDIAASSNATLTTYGMDKKDQTGPGDACPAVTGTTLICTLTRWQATYTYDPESGVISARMDPIGPNPDPAETF